MEQLTIPGIGEAIKQMNNLKSVIGSAVEDIHKMAIESEKIGNALKVTADAKEVLELQKKIADLQNKLANNTQKVVTHQEKMDAINKKITATLTNEAQEISTLNARLNEYNKNLKLNGELLNAGENKIKSYKLSLQKITQEYENLTTAERNSDYGKGLMNQIQVLNRSISEYKEETQKLVKEQKELKKESGLLEKALKKKGLALKSESKLIEKTKIETAELIKQQKLSINVLREEEGSIARMKARLKEARFEYDKMSEARRNSTKGKKLDNEINELQEKLALSTKKVQTHKEKLDEITKKINYSLSKEAQEVANLDDKLKENTQTLRNNARVLNSNNDSVTKYKAELKVLQKTYDDLDEAGRNSDFGKNLLKNIQELNLKISQNKEETQKLVKEQKELKKESELLEKALKKKNLALSDSGKELQKVRMETNAVNKENRQNIIINNEEEGSLVKLRAELSQLTLQYDKLGRARRNSAEGSRLQKQINSKQQEIRGAEFRTGRFQRNVGNYRSALNNIDDVADIAGVGGGMIGMVARVSPYVAVVGALALGYKEVVDKVKEFTSAQSEMMAILGVTRNQIGDLTLKQMELGKTTVFTATEVVKASTELAKLGFTVEEIEKSLKGVLDGAVAMGVGIAESAELTSKTLKAFEYDVTETDRVVSVLASSTARTATNFQYLNDALPYASTGANQMGFSVERLNGMLGVLADRGIKASMAGVSLRDIFSDLSAKGLTYEEAMNRIRNATDQNAEAFSIFGKTSMNSAVILANNTEEVDKLTEAMTNQEGALKILAETRLDNLEGDMRLATSAYEGMILAMDSGQGIIGESARAWYQLKTELFGMLTPSDLNIKAMQDEQVELNLLASKILDTNTKEEDRKDLLLELKQIYPNIIDFTKSEKEQLDDLKGALDDVNDAYVKRMILMESQNDLKELQNEEIESLRNLGKARTKLFNEAIRLQAELNRKQQEGSKLTKEEQATLNRRFNLQTIETDVQGTSVEGARGTKSIWSSATQKYTDIIEDYKNGVKEANKEVENGVAEHKKQIEAMGLQADLIDDVKGKQREFTNELKLTTVEFQKLQKQAVASNQAFIQKGDKMYWHSGKEVTKREDQERLMRLQRARESGKDRYSFNGAWYSAGDNYWEQVKGIEKFDDDAIESYKKRQKMMSDIGKIEKKTFDDRQRQARENAKFEVDLLKYTLDIYIANFRDRNFTLSDNMKYIEFVYEQKKIIAEKEKNINLGVARSVQERNAIVKKYELELANIEKDRFQALEEIDQKQRDLNKTISERELRLFKLYNQEPPQNLLEYSQTLLEISEQRLKNEIDLKKVQAEMEAGMNLETAISITDNPKGYETDQIDRALKLRETLQELDKEYTETIANNREKLNERLNKLAEERAEYEELILDNQYKRRARRDERVYNRAIELSQKESQGIINAINKREEVVLANQSLTEEARQQIQKRFEAERQKAIEEQANREQALENQKRLRLLEINYENDKRDMERQKGKDLFDLNMSYTKLEREYEMAYSMRTARAMEEEDEEKRKEKLAKIETEKTIVLAEINDNYLQERENVQKTYNENENERTSQYYDERAEIETEALGKLADINNLFYDILQISRDADLENQLKYGADILMSLSNLFGQTTTLGKAFASASILIDTYQTVAKLLFNTFQSTGDAARTLPTNPIESALHTKSAITNKIQAGLAIAGGLARIAQINGISMFAEGTLDAPYTGVAIKDELGAELHFNKDWNLKSLGDNRGAKFTNIEKGDKILPADVTRAILHPKYIQTQTNNQTINIDYNKIGKAVGKNIQKKNVSFVVKNNKILKLTENGNTTIIKGSKPRTQYLR